MNRIGLFAYTTRPDAIRWAVYAAERLLDERVEVYVEDILSAAFPPELAARCETVAAVEFEKFADVVITFGGDGTLLGAARLLIGSDIPIMGVNVGKLGFLAEFPVMALDDALMDILKGNYRIVDRTTLETTISGKTYYALNEILIEKSSQSKMITVRAFVSEHHVADYRADGIIVATPTGSTAYSLAAGGPIITPSAPALCLTPVSPHTLTLRPLIVQDTSDIRLEIPADGSEAHLVADGTIIADLRPGDSATVRKSDHLIKLIKRAESTYYDLLREKLLWSADATRK